MRSNVKRQDTMFKTPRCPSTKILATLGPASSSPAMLRKLYDAGLDAVRLNFSHGTNDEHADRIELVRGLNRKLRRHILILQDLKGNRIRIGRLKAPLELKKRQSVKLVQAEAAGGAGEIPFDYRGSLKVIKKGHLSLSIQQEFQRHLLNRYYLVMRKDHFQELLQTTKASLNKHMEAIYF